MKWLQFAWKNLWRNARRSLLTVALLTLSVTSLLVAGGFALYTYDSLAQFSARESGHIVVTHRDYYDKEDETPLALGIGDYPSLSKAILRHEQVSSVLPQIEFSGLLSNGDKSSIYLGIGVEPELQFRLLGPMLKLDSGRYLASQPSADADAEVMLGSGLAKSMQAKVGDILTLMGTTADGVLNAMDVEVVGIYGSGKPELDKRQLMVHLNTAQELIASDRVSKLAVYLFDLEKAQTFAQSLKGELNDFAIRDWHQLAFFYHKVKGLYDRIFGVMGVILMVMIFFALFNSLSMAVVERTREIGTLAAMGTSRWQIVRNFILESSLLSLLGWLIGVLLAGGITLLLIVAELQMPPPPGMTSGYPLYINFSVELALLSGIATLLTALAAAYLAARKRSRQPIVEALAHV